MNNKEFKELKKLREAFSSHFNKPHTIPTEQWAWDFFTNYLKSNDDIKREAVGEFYQRVHDYLDINAEVYMVNSVFEIYENHIFNLTQKENNEQ